MSNADPPLPYVSRHLLRVIAGRKIAVTTWLLRREIELASDLNPALDALVQRRLIEPIGRCYRATQRGLDMAHAAFSNSPTNAMKKPKPATQAQKDAALANALHLLGRSSMPSTASAGSWSHAKPTPICNASTGQPYMGAELRNASTRPGAYDFLSLRSLGACTGPKAGT